MQHKKQSIRILLTIMLAIILMPIKVHAEGDIYIGYVIRSWENGRVVEKNATIHGSQFAWMTDNHTHMHNGWWYTRDCNVTIEDQVQVDEGATANIILINGTTMTFEEGIYVPANSTLNIYGQAGDTGVLYCHTDDNCSAGIGGREDDPCGTINIYGGTIDAKGDDNTGGSAEGGAGIGGGDEVSGGTIRIYGGNITARGATDAAGIGGGDDGASGNITIYGGKVNAKGGSSSRDGGAGIGSGNNANCDNITIYGGEITAQGGPDGAGIGGGDDGKGGTIKIYGGNINAKGGVCASGIGGGEYASAETIRIEGGTIEATGGSGAAAGGAGIGGGENGSGGDITITGGTIKANGGHNGAGIGGGDWGDGGTITIENGTIEANGSEEAAGIGGGCDRTFSKIRIKGGKITAKGGDFAAGIGSGDRDSATKGSKIEISGGEIEAHGGKDGAGIGGGESVTGGEINISGGTIYAYGGSNANAFFTNNGESGGAGIGGGDEANGGTINISGGDIKEAKGGYDSAGIGGGDGKSDGGTITISGGTVNAIGKSFSAGIGGGNRGGIGNINIKGGTVTATGGKYAAGIGGGYNKASGSISISGGTVTANGGAYGGAAIGSGIELAEDESLDITISGGEVIAHGGHGGFSEFNYKNEMQLEGSGIGCGGEYQTQYKENGTLGKIETNHKAYFNGTIKITGGIVTTDGIGATGNESLKGKNPGTIKITGGTVNVKKGFVKGKTTEFGDNMCISGVEIEQRESKLNSAKDAYTIEECSDHSDRTYTDQNDGKFHSWQCKYCKTTGTDALHGYDYPTWTWPDGEGSTRAIATFTCEKCGHVETREAEKLQDQVTANEADDDVDADAAEVHADAEETDVDTTDFDAAEVNADAEENDGDPDAVNADEAIIARVIFQGKTYTDERDKQDYDIETAPCENGKVEVPVSGKSGTIIPVTVTHDAHYHIKSISVNGAPLEIDENGSGSFTMPKGNVKVRAEFEIDTVKLSWISRDYVYDYEKDEYTDQLEDTVEYIEEIPYGYKGELPEAGEFSALYGKCGLKAWEVKVGDRAAKEMQPGDEVVADADTSLTAIWLEHDFTCSVSEDGATITAKCSAGDHCSLTDAQIKLTIRKPEVSTYGDAEKGLSENATVTTAGLEAFGEYVKDLEAMAGDYIKYYEATKDEAGIYTKNGDALAKAPAEAGDYVAEIKVDDVKTEDPANTSVTASVGYTIDKADPVYTIQKDLVAKPGQKLNDTGFNQPANGTWSWNQPQKGLLRGGVYKEYATFTPNDTDNYNILTDIKVAVLCGSEKSFSDADTLVEDARKAVKAAVNNPTAETVKAAQDALAKISTDFQKAIYGDDLKKDQKAVEAAKNKVEEKEASDKKAAEELNTARSAATKAIADAESVKTDPAVAKAITDLQAAAKGNDPAAIKAATDKLSAAVTAAKAKPAPKVKIKTKSKTIKASKLKKKARSFKLKYSKAKGSGKASFTKLSGSKKLTVSKAGKIKVKKGTKKGTYKIKVKMTVAASEKFKETTAKKTIKVTVK